MPNDTISQTFISQFATQLHVEQQQLMSKFRPYADIGPLSGEDFYYDAIGVLEDSEVTGRGAASTPVDPKFTRRRGVSQKFVITVHLDDRDVERMMTDPTAQLVRACVAAMHRRFDRLFNAALFADVKVGRDANSTQNVSFAADGGLTVNATAGLTYAKLLEIGQNFIDNDVEEGETIFAVSGDEHTAMMNLSQLTSGDYTREMVVDKGDIQRALGMQVIKFAGAAPTPILNINGSGYRECAAFRKGAVKVGLTKDVNVTLKDRADKVDTQQIQATFTMAAVRKEGKLVQKVTTTP